MIHAESHHHRELRPRSRAGLAAFSLAAAGVALALPSEIGDPNAHSTTGLIGFACLLAAIAVGLYAVTVLGDRSWLTLASLLGVVLTISPMLVLAAIVAAVAISMNLLRDRGRGRGPRSEVAAAPRSIGARVARGGALVVMIAAHVAAAAAFFLLMFLSGSGLLDVGTLVGSVMGFVVAWWRRPEHPVQAALLAWLVFGGIVGVLAAADHAGLLGA